MLRLFILALGLLLAPLSSAGSCHSRFDTAFEAYVGAYLPDVDWRLLRAQCYQESRLDPYAVSPAGAQGLCQFMPATWRDMQNRHGIAAGPFNPYANARAAAIYMGQLRRAWYSPRPEYDRHSLALASYNAGLGNLVAAQRQCEGATLWPEVARCLPQVTGRHSAETLHYVPAIWGHYKRCTQ